MAESEEELNSILMNVKVEREKAGLKLNIQKIKNMTSSPITSWKIFGEKLGTVTDFILGGPKLLKNQWLIVMNLKDAYSLEEKLWQT